MENTQRLEAELRQLKDRIEKIELTLFPPPPPPAPRTVVAERHQAPNPAFARHPSNAAEPEGESSVGNFLGIVAVICFVLAASFLVKLSIESGWLDPTRRILLSALFGFGLVVFGSRYRKHDVGCLSLLPAAGVVVLYLTAAGGHALYDLYPP